MTKCNAATINCKCYKTDVLKLCFVTLPWGTRHNSTCSSVLRRGREGLNKTLKFKGAVQFFCTLSLMLRIFYEHIQCITTLLWQTVQSCQVELFADFTASWKQWRLHRQSKNAMKTPFKSRDTCRMFSGVLWCTNTKTQSCTTAYDPETAVCFPKQLQEPFLGHNPLRDFMF